MLEKFLTVGFIFSNDDKGKLIQEVIAANYGKTIELRLYIPFLFLLLLKEPDEAPDSEPL